MRVQNDRSKPACMTGSASIYSTLRIPKALTSRGGLPCGLGGFLPGAVPAGGFGSIASLSADPLDDCVAAIPMRDRRREWKICGVAYKAARW